MICDCYTHTYDDTEDILEFVQRHARLLKPSPHGGKARRQRRLNLLDRLVRLFEAAHGRASVRHDCSSTSLSGPRGMKRVPDSVRVKVVWRLGRTCDAYVRRGIVALKH